MLIQQGRIRNNQSAHERFLKPAISNFFSNEFPSLFGSIIREKIATELMNIFENLNVETNRLKPGQMLWNCLDKNTRASSTKKAFVPVILTILADDDISDRQRGISLPEIRGKVIARITQEAYEQGGLLSMRDIGLLLVQSDSTQSIARIAYEQRTKTILPHVGNIHDVGTCTTHKMQIIYKAVIEKKDPMKISKETNHSQKAVDRYLQSYSRVKTLFLDGKNPEFICTITNISKNVVSQYINLIKKYEKIS